MLKGQDAFLPAGGAVCGGIWDSCGGRQGRRKYRALGSRDGLGNAEFDLIFHIFELGNSCGEKEERKQLREEEEGVKLLYRMRGEVAIPRQ